MYIASLSSSSTYGNAYLVWDESCRPILVDCGISLKRLACSLRSLGMQVSDLAGLFISHEHMDHIRAMCLATPLAQKYNIPVYASRGFWDWYFSNVPRYVDPLLIRVVRHGEPVSVSGFRVLPFAKPHDAAEPLGFLVESAGERVAFVMDLGHFPRYLAELLRGVENLVFETNYDLDMELSSGRPASLVKRITGDYGHLSNEQAAAALASLVTSSTRRIVLAHLSIDCNRPQLARQAVAVAVTRAGFVPSIFVAPAEGMAVYP